MKGSPSWPPTLPRMWELDPKMSDREDLTEELRNIQLEAKCAQESIYEARKGLTRLEVALGSLEKKLAEQLERRDAGTEAP